jgi:protocatechuate 3,4-dioxygenase beta subunit
VLLASASGFISQVAEINGPDASKSIDIRLVRGGVEVSGRIVDATGGPIAGALITVRAALPSEHASNITSDESGRFALSVPEGAIDLGVQSEGYARAVRSLQAPAQGLTIMLLPGSSISGRVVARGTRRPLPDVLVSAHPEHSPGAGAGQVLSDADGSFRIDGLTSGTYAVQALSGSAVSEPVQAILGVTDTSTELEISMLPAATLRATVLLPTGPCTRGAVEMSGSVWRSSSTDAQGQVELPGVPPGVYVITARCDQALPMSESLEIATEPVNRVFELAPGAALRGSVVSASGMPLPGVRVLAEPVLAPAVAQGAAAPRSVECVMEEGGSFSCAGLTAGEHECTAFLGGRPVSKPVRVITSEGSVPDVQLRAQPLGELRALLPAQDRGREQVLVLALPAGKGPVEGVRRGDSFVFEGLELGKYAVYQGLTAEPPAGSRSAELVRDGEVVEVELAPAPRLAIRGVVRDGRGAPVLDAWVRVIGTSFVAPNSLSNPVLTTEAGFFEIDGLLPGQYDVTAASPSGSVAVSGIDAGGRTLDLRVSPESANAG